MEHYRAALEQCTQSVNKDIGRKNWNCSLLKAPLCCGHGSEKWLGPLPIHPEKTKKNDLELNIGVSMSRALVTEGEIRAELVVIIRE